MKSSIFWGNVENYIYFTTFETGWETNWDVLYYNDEPVTDLSIAIQLVREYMKGQKVGLAKYNQMILNNAEWDNL